MNKFAARLAQLLGLGVLVWVAAYWIWEGLRPAIVPEPPVVTADALRVLDEWAPFGRGAPAAPGAAAAPSAASTDLLLLGVAAQADGDGWALLQRSDKTIRLLRAGAEIAPGLRLAKVFPHGVEVVKDGVGRKLELRRARSAAHPAAPAAPVTSCPANAEERRRAYFVHPELLTGFAKGMEAARKQFRQDGGAWVVVELDPALAALGFAVGDRIEKGNGVPLLTEDSLRSAIFEPVMQSRLLRLSGTRQGKAKEWIYVNAALCPR
ncbi:hypothetical protein BURK2_00267 [Burkholderiales bacterium]|nr:hypothetical protein BURK2_00267 [Burkholderiales bacterium]